MTPTEPFLSSPWSLAYWADLLAIMGKPETQENVNKASYLINRATAIIEGYTDRKFVYRAYYEKFNGGQTKLFTSQYPINPLNNEGIIYIEVETTTPPWYQVPATDYRVHYREGYIELLWGAVPTLSGVITADGSVLRGVRNIEVAYHAGYIVDWTFRQGTQNWNDDIATNGEPTTHALPYDLTQVCLNLALEMWNVEKTAGIVSESVEGASVSYGSSSGTFSDADKAILDRYKRVSVAGVSGSPIGFQ